MAFDLFVHRIREDGDTLYPRTVAESIFNRGASMPSRLLDVEYHDGDGEAVSRRQTADGRRQTADGRRQIICGEEPMINGFMLTHFGGDVIVQRALEIAAVTRSLVFWPGSPIFSAVTDRGVIVDLPHDAWAPLGETVVVATAAELWAAIEFEG